MKKIIIDENIFKQFPDFVRGVIVVESIDNALENKEISVLLSKEIEKRGGNDLVQNDMVKIWDDVHSKFGSKPNRYPPSIKALLKRIQKGGSIPFINSTVALFNYVSIKYLFPCGGDDVDTIEGDLYLGFAKGNEKFISLGSTEQEEPFEGEVIYFDSKTLNVMCRRWNWRNGDFTKITENTKKLVINIDCVSAGGRKLTEEARDELAGLLTQHCKASVQTYILDKDTQEIAIQI